MKFLSVFDPVMREPDVLRQHHQALWHNTTVRHCDRTKTLACQIYKTPPFSRYYKSCR